MPEKSAAPAKKSRAARDFSGTSPDFSRAVQEKSASPMD
jgi:hypothetical protein